MEKMHYIIISSECKDILQNWRRYLLIIHATNLIPKICNKYINKLSSSIKEWGQALKLFLYRRQKGAQETGKKCVHCY